MYKEFGNSKSVFVNQDEGMFVALPITLDETALTLETETRHGRKYAIAGSVVKEGASVRGILAEEYDITDGPTPARIVLEGYAWASSLTASALESAAALPKIVVMPYKYISLELAGTDATAHKMVIRLKEGAKFASTISTSNVTASAEGSGTLSSVALNAAKDELTLTFSAADTYTVSAIAAAGFVGISTGTVVKGLPIEAAI